MRRREFLGSLGIGFVAWSSPVRAQSGPVRHLGILMPYTENDSEDRKRVKALTDALGQFGWAINRNIQISIRWYAGNHDRARVMAKELVALQPDVIVGAATPGLEALLQETRKIPIVFIGVSDPVAQKFVESLSRPGGNATGFTLFEFSIGGKLLEAVREIAPKVSRVSLLFEPSARSSISYLRAIEDAAPRFKFEVIRSPVRSASDIESAIAAIGDDPKFALIVPPDPFTNVHRALIIEMAARYRVPAAYSFRHFALGGGLMSFGIDVNDLFRRSAEYVNRILAGTVPADLPVQQPTKFEFVVNLKAANKLGLVVPPTLLARADEVIE
jgi:putative ABC transport system substrate-binding protein